jgi:phospholipid N-methyltransferase
MNDIRYEGRDLEVLGDMPNYYSWIMDSFADHIHGRVIEYGSGTGTFTERLLPRATSLVAVEPSGNLLPTLSSRFKSCPDVEICNETLEAHVARQSDNSCNTVVMVNVLEHIEGDRAALRDLLRILRPDGSLLLFVPALSMLMSKLDRMHGHFRRYHKSELEAKVKATGAAVVQCSYFDAIGVLPWFILNTIMGSTSFNPALVRINDRYVVPLGKRLENSIELPFGKNLILVARKPA